MTHSIAYFPAGGAPSRRRAPRREARRSVLGEALKPREAEICELVALAWSNKEIAVALGLSEQTIKNYLREAYAKLGVTTRMELMRHWLRQAHAAATTETGAAAERRAA